MIDLIAALILSIVMVEMLEIKNIKQEVKAIKRESHNKPKYIEEMEINYKSYEDKN